MLHSIETMRILDGLAPSKVILPTVQKRSKCVVVDETTNNVIHNPMYINRFNNNEELPDIEDVKRHVLFTEGLQIIENEGLLNVTNLGLWKASSHKVGNSIENVLNINPESYWQSDSGQPHIIDVYFSRRMDIILLALYFSLTIDESYTPRLFKLYVGHSPSDAVHYKTFQLENINGWMGITFEDNRPDNLMKCQFLRIVIPLNHENGKDTHLRGIQLYTPSLRNQSENTLAGFPQISSMNNYTIR